MFGSLRISRCQLTDETRQLYRGTFCGACHAMREFSGRISSFLANYDQTVLGLVLGGLERVSTVERRGCTAMPLRKVSVVVLSDVGREYLAAANLALVEAKLRDDVDDESRLRSRIGLRVLNGPARRAEVALRALSFPYDEIAGLPRRQAQAEASAAASLADLSAPSAELTGSLFAFAARLTEQHEKQGPLRRFGEALGRWIYIEDACQDRLIDRRKGQFNAIDASLGPEAGDELAREDQRMQLDRLQVLLPQLDLGSQAGVLDALLLTMRSKVSPPRWSAEAGDCDCDCCIAGSNCGCDCCGECCCWGQEMREKRRRRKLEKRGG